MEEENIYDINTGYIYQELCYEHTELGIDFFKKLEDNIRKVLNHHRIISIEWDRNKDGMKQYYDEWVKEERTEDKPYTDFYLSRTGVKDRKKSEYPYDLIEYNAFYVIDKEKDDYAFDYFFALKLLVTDIMEIKRFLGYQLNINFGSSSHPFREFLGALLVKYEHLFENTKVPIMVNKYLEENLTKEGRQTVELSDPIKWQGTAGQLIYLFELLHKENFLPAAMDLQAEIRRHFLDNKGKPFTVLKQSKQNYLNSKTGKPKQADKLESAVLKVKSHK